MRIAVLIHGQPRYLEQGAWWFKNRVFPDHFKRLNVDYYTCFWEDGNKNLASRVQESYSPIKHSQHSYERWRDKIADEIGSYNKTNPLVNHISPTIKSNVMFCDDHYSNYQLNYWGQYMSCGLITQMVGDLTGQYDIVIRTRSDVAFNPMSEEMWLRAFHNMERNPVFHDKIMSDWLYVAGGRAFVGDFAFFSKPEVWYKFTKDMYKNCVKIATEDCLLWYDEKYNEDQHISFPHKTWTNLSVLSKTNWLSFAVVWPTPYASTLIRQDGDISRENFQSLVNQYHAQQ